MNKTICVDVDGTVVETSAIWLEWCKKNYRVFHKDLWDKDKGFEMLGYNFGKYFEDPFKKDLDICDFWMQYDLYDEAVVYPEAYRVLKKLHDQGWNVVFSSYSIEHNHHGKSKVDFLLRNFDFIKPHDFVFIQTHNKGSMERAIDVFVDDRNNFCNQFTDDVVVLRLNTPFEQDVKLKNHSVCVDSWDDIEFLIDVFL